MQTKKYFVQDIRAGQQIDDTFMVIRARQAQARNGPYWQLTLQDRTGEIQARVWNPLSRQFQDIPQEQLVRIRASSQVFGDQLQLNIDDMHFIDQDQADPGLFLPVSCTPPEELHQNLILFLQQNVSYPGWKKLVKKILTREEIKEPLLKAPAAKSIHHAYMGGLLEHTLSVCRICNQICDLYPDLDRDILLCAAALHDLGKTMEILPGASRDYSHQGKLLGHIFLGLDMINPFLDKAKELDEDLIMHFKHIIISHHGELEFGSPKRPKTREAFVLHFADNLDAKIKTLDQALAGGDESEESAGTWSDYQRSLGRFVFQPARTPRPPESPREQGGKKEGQCLLPLKE
ncbi:metal dependent phosphohydrolase [Desulfonatronospira thiodismutans ASO3-1]|uniref:Metal dependent phosphohydrolase n=1 Tax=Desulfonatronospira thiodismutans ASO3-1 TaxID=555779 RepID=D6SSW1_9BACT|nr:MULTISPECIES: HD domain-containing protein [Desulfonatronospira]EFI33777.1 metal dependent phosphohydrolase [Desulfonatronospira thiodismutans ASO3-1]RQD78166.1 MAG: HD domain-containing protein [Desulfonatronospira sp. MSAO_Bac3]